MTKGPPTSGGEHTFTTRRWGGNVGKNNNNCYAYAVNDFQMMSSLVIATGVGRL